MFHQVIAMSGSATAGWAVHRYGPVQWDMFNIAEYMRCNKIISKQDLNDILTHEPSNVRKKKHEFCNLQDSIPDCLIVILFLIIKIKKKIFFNFRIVVK